MSPRLPPTAIAKMLGDVDCSQMITTQAGLETTGINAASKIMSSEGRALKILPAPCLPELFPLLASETSNDPFRLFRSTTKEHELSDVAFYLHSSGSSGLPKTIPQTEQSILDWCSFGASYARP
jgi:acyl-coenzyme A synthetase/AMP-(fatty) acid ligase